MQKVVFRDLGLIDYQEAWNYQEKIFNKIIEDKRKTAKKKPLITHSLIFYFVNIPTFIP